MFNKTKPTTMKISTARIDIVPLCLQELELIIKSRAEFEKISDCCPSGVELPPVYCEELSEMLEQNRSKWKENPNDYLFYTLWVMICRETKIIIGQFSFNAKPNADGEIEVFFSIEEPYRRKGYAFEVMQGVIGWAKESGLIRKFLIEADFDNKAAMASLKKLGFKPVLPDDVESEFTSTKYYLKLVNPEALDEDMDFD